MKIGRRGFTMIEVAIFLVITGILFIGVTVGVQNSIYQQRKNDSVQSFVEFLRGVYSKVANVQNTEGGRSEKAIYGKLITFGEEYDLAGKKLDGDKIGREIFTYTVIGEIKDEGTGSALSLLSDLKANVFVKEGGEDGAYKLAGIAESYTPKWAAEIEPACSGGTCSYEAFEGMVLIVRHPTSGNIYTFYSPKVAQINEMAYNVSHFGTPINPEPFKYRDGAEDKNYLDESNVNGFKMGQIDFCINSSGTDGDTARSDVRIISGATNSSGVEIVPDEGNKCR